MNVKKIAIVADMVAGALVANANAADQGHGKITFTGTIVDAPCSIDSKSVDQTISLGAVSNVALKADGNTGVSPMVPFEIELKNCDTTTKKTVTTTFSGTEGANAGSLAIVGSAKGASIILTDGGTANAGQIKLGEASKPHGLVDGDNTLYFGAYLQGDGAAATVTPGEFSAVTNFTLAYQ